MIDGNVLKFGYGDIATGADVFSRAITFQQFKPPGECGDTLDCEVEYIGEEIVLQLSYEEYCKLDKLMIQIINKNIVMFSFREYIFDFSNYNEESVRVVRRKLNEAISWYLLCCAA
jgi:hypothetical protein